MKKKGTGNQRGESQSVLTQRSWSLKPLISGHVHWDCLGCNDINQFVLTNVGGIMKTRGYVQELEASQESRDFSFSRILSLCVCVCVCVYFFSLMEDHLFLLYLFGEGETVPQETWANHSKDSMDREHLGLSSSWGRYFDLSPCGSMPFLVPTVVVRTDESCWTKVDTEIPPVRTVGRKSRAPSSTGRHPTILSHAQTQSLPIVSSRGNYSHSLTHLFVYLFMCLLFVEYPLCVCHCSFLFTFFYLALSGLSSGMWDLSHAMQALLMWHMDSLVAPLHLQ